MMKKKSKIAAVFLSAIMMVLTACGNASGDVQETIAPVEEETEKIEDEAVVEDKAEVETGEVEPEETEPEEAEPELIPYAEENGLEFCDDMVLAIKGIRREINNEDDKEEMDAEWTIKSIEISEAEDGFQTITIEHECTGYLWTDQKNRCMFNISMPSASYCDLNTGECFPVIMMDEDMKLGYQTKVTWDGKVYEIDYTEETEWNDGTDWTPDGKGGYTLPSTMCITDTFVVTEGYESMGVIISSLTVDELSDKPTGVYDEQEIFINEVLENCEDCYLFRISDIYNILHADGSEHNLDVDTKASEGGTVANDKKPEEEAVHQEPEQKSQQETHTHNYTSNISKNATCSETGVKIYTCSCGDIYTEEIPKTDHQWVPVTESVYHPSTGHYETVTKKEAWCGCGARFQSQADLTAHQESGVCDYGNCGVDEWTENVWVVDQPEYYADEVTGYQCSVCGVRQ